MFAIQAFRAVQTLAFFGAMLLLAGLPCVAWSQAAPQNAATRPVLNSAGLINSLTGVVFIRKGKNSPPVPAKPGDSVDSGNIISTGAGGEVVLLFTDGQHVTLSADSVLSLDEYRYDTRDSRANRVTFTLDEGMMRIVTGAMHAANTAALTIFSEDAVITVVSKGPTSFVVEADARVAGAGSVAVIVGEVSIARKQGPVIVVGSEQFSRWQPALAAARPQPLEAAPATLQAMASFEAPQAGTAPPIAMRVGFVNSMDGDVFIRDSKGVERAAKAGDLVGTGNVVRTGAEGEVVLLFPDGQLVSMSAESVLRIDEYRFDMRDLRQSKSTLGLVEGSMYVASGAISAANPEALKVSAGDSLLGVRGTDPTSFVVEVDRKTSREAGSVVVLVGLVSIQRPDGSIVSVATNQYSRWQPAVTAEPAKALAAAPAEMQGTVSVLQVKVGAEDVPQDIQAAVQEALESLPPTAAGELELAAPTLPTPVAATGITPVLLVFTPGAAGGCVGSPC